MLVAGLLAAAPAPTPKGRVIEHDSKILQFSYSWPQEAAAIPALDRQFRSEAAKAYRHAAPLARTDHAEYVAQGRADVSDFFSMKWTTAGQSGRLLSLQYERSTYTGGAHPNTSYGALLWDRRFARKISIDALFIRGARGLSVIRTAYCGALNKERRKRRNGMTMGLPEFEQCPGFGELALSPVDADGSGRFEQIDVVASPYTAGPYAEGAYSIRVPATSALIAALKPEYRASFEIQRQ